MIYMSKMWRGSLRKPGVWLPCMRWHGLNTDPADTTISYGGSREHWSVIALKYYVWNVGCRLWFGYSGFLHMVANSQTRWWWKTEWLRHDRFTWRMKCWDTNWDEAWCCFTGLIVQLHWSQEAKRSSVTIPCSALSLSPYGMRVVGSARGQGRAGSDAGGVGDGYCWKLGICLEDVTRGFINLLCYGGAEIF